MDLKAYPGGDLVEQGLLDLARGVESVPSLLVSMAVSRLRELGLTVPDPPPAASGPETRMYALLSAELGDAAHSRYNALRRRLLVVIRAVRCGKDVDRRRIEMFIDALGRRVLSPCRVYITGGGTALLHGWRASTLDIDVRISPDGGAMNHIAAIKRKLQINIKLASPSDFIPPLPGWEERSAFIQQVGNVAFFHYDYYAQALAKLERGFGQDVADVDAMLAAGLVQPQRALELFRAIEPDLVRYPAVDPATFRAAVERKFAHK